MVRWIKRKDSGDTAIWQMIQDQRYIEYDEYQDEYTKIATLPVEDVGEGVVDTDYGLYLEGESFDLPQDDFDFDGIAIDGDRIFGLDSQQIYTLLLDGSVVAR